MFGIDLAVAHLAAMRVGEELERRRQEEHARVMAEAAAAFDEAERRHREHGAIDVEARWVEDTPALLPPKP